MERIQPCLRGIPKDTDPAFRQLILLAAEMGVISMTHDGVACAKKFGDHPQIVWASVSDRGSNADRYRLVLNLSAKNKQWMEFQLRMSLGRSDDFFRIIFRNPAKEFHEDQRGWCVCPSIFSRAIQQWLCNVYGLPSRTFHDVCKIYDLLPQQEAHSATSRTMQDFILAIFAWFFRLRSS